MRAVAALFIAIIIGTQTGCDPQPVTHRASAAPSPALRLYRELSRSFAQCDTAGKKSDETNFLEATASASTADVYRAASEQFRACNLAASNILKLGETEIQPKEANSALADTIEVCVSEAVSKASSGEEITHRVVHSKGNTSRISHHGPKASRLRKIIAPQH